MSFRKLKVPAGWVNPMWIIDPPGATTSIACCLLTSSPTESKTISKPFDLIILSFGATYFAFIYFEHSSNLFLLGSDKTISLQFLSLAKINPHNKPIAPAPWIKTLHSEIGFFKVCSPIMTACNATAVGSATAAYFVF